ncbi:MAG: alpha/beta fold hydrolase, partial [Spirochaetaceae bacterium]|nr:alpha/beta fold hydrolase [Spirochaetaceae bacterium]
MSSFPAIALLFLPLWLILANLALAGILALVAHRAMIRIKRRREDSIAEILLAKGEIRGEWLARSWIEARVPSPGNYDIAVHALPGNPGADPDGGRLVLFHHGVSWNWTGVLKYMEAFLRAGWTVVAFDSRGHGRSGGKDPSYGVYEKEDLKAVADWALGRFPAAGGFGAFGLSLGAAAVLQYAPLDPRLDFVVADCSFSSASAELDHRLRRGFVPAYLRPLVLRLMDRLCRLLDGFSLYEADPSAAALRTSLPILFIHGLEDDYVPWTMSAEMAVARRRALPGATTELLLVPGAAHAKSFKADPAAYEARLLAFAAAALARRAEPRPERGTDSRAEPRPERGTDSRAEPRPER